MENLENMLGDFRARAKKALTVDSLFMLNTLLTLYIAKKMGIENVAQHCVGLAVVSSVEKYVKEIGEDSREEITEAADGVYPEIMKLVDSLLDKVSSIDELPPMDSL